MSRVRRIDGIERTRDGGRNRLRRIQGVLKDKRRPDEPGEAD
jgi:hypothetical protein